MYRSLPPTLLMVILASGRLSAVPQSSATDGEVRTRTWSWRGTLRSEHGLAVVYGARLPGGATITVAVDVRDGPPVRVLIERNRSITKPFDTVAVFEGIRSDTVSATVPRRGRYTVSLAAPANPGTEAEVRVTAAFEAVDIRTARAWLFGIWLATLLGPAVVLRLTAPDLLDVDPIRWGAQATGALGTAILTYYAVIGWIGTTAFGAARNAALLAAVGGALGYRLAGAALGVARHVRVARGRRG
jgi:hypothetical protein